MKTAATAAAFAVLSTSAFAQDLSASLPESVGKVAPALEAYVGNALFDDEWSSDALAPRDRALVTFAAALTRHETEALERYLTLALDAGVTASELSETITHLAFYTGLENAVAAAEAAAPVFAARGISTADLPGATTDLLPLNEEAEAARESLVQGNYGDVSQGVVDHTRDVLFRDLWLRADLAARDRSLITVAALIAAGQPEQMSFHLNRAMDNGLSQAEASGMLSHLAFYTGWPKVFSALPVAKQVFESRN